MSSSSPLHPHCLRCFKVNVNALTNECNSIVPTEERKQLYVGWQTTNHNKKDVLPPPSDCPIVSCDVHSCGMRMHACKLADHKTICLSQQVNCLNHWFGCNAILIRGKTASHLPVCPASVLQCGKEWTRWPDRRGREEKEKMSYMEDEEQQAEKKQQMKTTIRESFSGAINVINREKTKHLFDVALALRDEKTLKKKMKQMEEKEKRNKCNIIDGACETSVGMNGSKGDKQNEDGNLKAINVS